MMSLETIGLQAMDAVQVYSLDAKNRLLGAKQVGRIKCYVEHPNDPERGIVVVRIPGNGNIRVPLPLPTEGARKVIKKLQQ